ncbi:TIGR04222 domain-containing membrane protein [Streptosporangium sp. NPDC000396]|uniref:TIGR04222 domain-containing membrane protein n=1 Tax=Streptosporangium sp. NPDC000396 TaxID=3366185 RepID=UPI0036BE933E
MTPTLITIAVVALLAVAGLIAVRLAMHSTKTYQGPELTAYELAELAAGRFRVLNTALASLSARKMIRIEPGGKLTRMTVASEGTVHPVEADILALLETRRDGAMVWEVKAEVARGPAVAALIERLLELELVEDEVTRIVPTRLGQAALAHYRLRHREERTLPPRPRDHHTSEEEFNLCGVALYGLHQMADQEAAAVLSMSGTTSSPPRGPARDTP